MSLGGKETTLWMPSQEQPDSSTAKAWVLFFLVSIYPKTPEPWGEGQRQKRLSRPPERKSELAVCRGDSQAQSCPGPFISEPDNLRNHQQRPPTAHPLGKFHPGTWFGGTTLKEKSGCQQPELLRQLLWPLDAACAQRVEAVPVLLKDPSTLCPLNSGDRLCC